ncbi:MAG TPA: hypothetical protein VGJ86_23490 [Acidimicrobiales bacterium]|jgi:hypothetical protein
MKRRIVVALLFVLLAACGGGGDDDAAPATTTVKRDEATTEEVSLEDAGVVGTLALPADDGRHPAVLVLGGSDGRPVLGGGQESRQRGLGSPGSLVLQGRGTTR